MPAQTYKIERLDDVGNPEAAYTYNFQSLTGVVLLTSTQIEVITRRGIDGAGIRDIGSRPAPFTLRGMAFHQSFTDAKAAIAALEALKGHQYGVRLTKESINYGAFDVVAVVEAGNPRAVGAVAGALIANPTVRQRYAITLLERVEA